LPTFREIDDHRSVGVILGQLGALALRRGDLAEAARRYTEALETFRALGELQSEAIIWHQLGMVAKEAKEWDEAERCYRESLKLKEAQGDLPGVARTCNQLAIVARGAGRPDDAERWYLRAIELGEQLGDRRGLGVRLGNLAGLYLSQGRLDEAARYAHRALEIKETLDLSAQPWTPYAILARIAEAQGRADEAAGWRRKEQESYAAYAGAAHQLPQWAPSFIAAVVAAVQGSEAAKQEAEEVLPRLEAAEWHNLCNAVRRVLQGEHDFDMLRTDLDREDAYIVRAILAQLSGGAPVPPAAQTSPDPRVGAGAGVQAQQMTLDDLLGRIAQACTPSAPPGLGEQLFGLTRSMSTDPDAPPEVHALGRALNAVLSGERAPDLSALPPELAEGVRRMLATLE